MSSGIGEQFMFNASCTGHVTCPCLVGADIRVQKRYPLSDHPSTLYTSFAHDGIKGGAEAPSGAEYVATILVFQLTHNE